MKKLVSILVCLFSVFALISPCMAADKKDDKNKETKEDNTTPEVTKDPIIIYQFSREDCPHCISAAAYFNELKTKKDFAGKIEYKEYEVFDAKWNINSENLYKLMAAVADVYGDNINDEKFGTPYIIVGDKSFIGYASSLNEEIEAEIKRAYNDANYVDQVANVTIPEEKNNDTANTVVLVAILGTILIGGTALVIWSRKQSK